MVEVKKGYYSVVQYVPDLDRAESVNIGVLLFVAETSFCEVRLSRDNRRVRHFFNTSSDDLIRLTEFKRSFVHRIKSEKFHTIEQLKKFINTRGNQIQMTEPRFVKVTETCKDQLDHLFEDLVDYDNNF